MEDSSRGADFADCTRLPLAARPNPTNNQKTTRALTATSNNRRVAGCLLILVLCLTSPPACRHQAHALKLPSFLSWISADSSAATQQQVAANQPASPIATVLSGAPLKAPGWPADGEHVDSMLQAASTSFGPNQRPLEFSSQKAEAPGEQSSARSRLRAPFQMFSSLPKSLFGRLLSSGSATTSTTAAPPTQFKTLVPERSRWMLAANQRPAPQFVEHRPSGHYPLPVAHLPQQHPVQYQPQQVPAREHALGLGESEDFFAVEPQPQSFSGAEMQPHPVEIGEQQVAENSAETPANGTSAEESANSASDPPTAAKMSGADNASSNNGTSNSIPPSAATQPATPANATASDSPGELANGEASERQNSTLGQQEAANQTSSEVQQRQPVDGAIQLRANQQEERESPLENPESGRQESAAAATIVQPAEESSNQQRPAPASGSQQQVAGKQWQSEPHVNSDESGADQFENFVLSPFNGLAGGGDESGLAALALAASTGDTQFIPAPPQPQLPNYRHQSSPAQFQRPIPQQLHHRPLSPVGMASSLLQQARNLIQFPFAGGSAFRGQQDGAEQLAGQSSSFVAFNRAPSMVAPMMSPAQQSSYRIPRPFFGLHQQPQLQPQRQPAGVWPPIRSSQNSHPPQQDRYFMMPAASAPRQQQPQQFGPPAANQLSASPLAEFASGRQPVQAMTRFLDQQPQYSLAADRSRQHQSQGLSLALEHARQQQPGDAAKTQPPRSSAKFKSGFYQIDAPKLIDQNIAFGSEQQQQQQQIPDADEQDNEDNDSQRQVAATSSQSGADDGDEDDDNEQQATESSIDVPRARQVGASIGVNETRQVKGQVFSEPISSVAASENQATLLSSARPQAPETSAGQNLTQTRALKSSEDVTLYDVEIPHRELGNEIAEPSQNVSLLDTQVYTVPYVMSMQADGNAHLLAPPAQRQHHFVPHTFNQMQAPRAQQQFYLVNQGQPAQPVVSSQHHLARPQGFQSFVAPTMQQHQFAGPTRTFSQYQVSYPSQVAHWHPSLLSNAPALELQSVAHQDDAQHQYQPQRFSHYQPLVASVQSQLPANQQQPLAAPVTVAKTQAVESSDANGDHQQSPPQRSEFMLAISHDDNQNAQLAAATKQLTTPTTESLQQRSSTTTAQPQPVSVADLIADSITVAPEAASSSESSAGNEIGDHSTSTTEAQLSLENELAADLRQQQRQSTGGAGSRSPSSFCADRSPGLYADVGQRCKAYYQCAPTGHQMFRCNNQTQFNQKTQNCDWWYNVDCGGKLGSQSDFGDEASSSTERPADETSSRWPATSSAFALAQTSDNSDSSSAAPQTTMSNFEQQQQASPRTDSPTLSSTLADRSSSSAEPDPPAPPTTNSPIATPSPASATTTTAAAPTTGGQLSVERSAGVTEGEAASAFTAADSDASSSQPRVGSSELESGTRRQPEEATSTASSPVSPVSPQSRRLIHSEFGLGVQQQQAKLSRAARFDSARTGSASGAALELAPDKLESVLEWEAPIYSTSSNQGSVSYVPSTQPSGEQAKLAPATGRRMDRRFGTRLGSQRTQPPTTTTTSRSRR